MQSLIYINFQKIYVIIMILINGEKQIKKVSTLPLLSSSDTENHYNYNLRNINNSNHAIYSA